MKLAKFLSGIAAVLLVGGTLNAATISYTSTQKAGSTYVNFYLGKFDTGLGTLTGVTVNVVYSTLAGSILFTNQDATAASIGSFDSTVSVRQAPLSNLGYTQVNGTVYDVVTSPDWNTTVLLGHASETFTIGNGQNALTNRASTIDSNYWNAYSSAEGVGTVNFQVKNIQSVTTTGSSYTLDSTNAGANTQLTVTYTYDAGPVPVPEPSTVIVQILVFSAGVWAFVRHRRQTATTA